MSAATPQCQPLSSFQASQLTHPFKTATSYPDLFNTHLDDPLRMIKIFKDDPNGFERIFYFQYLKLCEPSAEGFPEIRVANMKQLINNPDFQFIFQGDFGAPQIYNDKQFKAIALDFLDMLKNNEIKVDRGLQKYPIVDLVFTSLMRSLTIMNNLAEEFEQFVDKGQLLNLLSSIFDVEVKNHQNCTKFIDSDIFVYEVSPFEIYMAYLIDQEQKPKASANFLGVSCRVDRKKKSEMYKSSTSNENYDFVDFTDLNTDKPSASHLYQSQNIFIKVQDKRFTKQQSLIKQPISVKSIKQQKIKVDAIVDKIQQEEQQVMQIKITQPNVLSVRNNMLQLRKQSKDFSSEVSGFESNQDDMKLQMPPTSGTFYISDKIQFLSNIEDGTETKNNSTHIPDKTIESNISENPQQPNTISYDYEKQFSFKDESMRLNKDLKKEASLIQHYYQPQNNQLSFSFSKPVQNQTENRNKNDQSYPAQEYFGASIRKSVAVYIPVQQYLNNNQHSALSWYETNFSTKSSSTPPRISLNVTKQFTNSFVLKEMPEIYSEGVRKARQRARAFRKTILQTF